MKMTGVRVKYVTKDRVKWRLRARVGLPQVTGKNDNVDKDEE